MVHFNRALSSQNAGQNCVGIEKLIVHQTQYEELYDIVVRRTKELRSGPVLAPPVEGFETYADVGAMISRDRFRDLKRVLDEAEHHGATIDTGGKPYVHPYFGSGSYFYPTVVGNPLHDSLVATRERTFEFLGLPLTTVVWCLPSNFDCSVRPYCLDPELRNCGRGHRARQRNEIRSWC